MQSISLEGCPFYLDLSVSCGQAFRWRRYDNIWYAPGPYGSESVWRVWQTDEMLCYDGAEEAEIIRYFSLDQNLPEILSEIDCDPLIHDAVTRCSGLRILRQDPWECLVSYICSSCANIPGIQRRIENISRKYGKRMICDGREFFSFPSPESLAEADIGEIRACRVGYRDAYICSAAEMAVTHPDWVSEVQGLPYPDAQKALCAIHGVGPKVADCVLLFAFEKLEAVPVDVWIERILRTKYLGGEKKLAYAQAGAYARKHFGRYAGYAQEYLFAARETITTKGA